MGRAIRGRMPEAPENSFLATDSEKSAECYMDTVLGAHCGKMSTSK